MFTMTAREFNQSVAKAQRIADGEPVLITRHGEPAYVLLSIDEYERLALSTADGASQSFLEMITSLPAGIDPDDEFGRIMDEIVADRKKDFGRPPIEF